MIKIICIAVAILYSFTGICSPEVEAKIRYVGTNSNDVVFVEFDKIINESGCAGSQLVLPPESAIKENILSVALLVKASNSTVIVKAKGCYIGKPSMLPDPVDWGWLYIK